VQLYKAVCTESTTPRPCSVVLWSIRGTSRCFHLTLWLHYRLHSWLKQLLEMTQLAWVCRCPRVQAAQRHFPGAPSPCVQPAAAAASPCQGAAPGRPAPPSKLRPLRAPGMAAVTWYGQALKACRQCLATAPFLTIASLSAHDSPSPPTTAPAMTAAEGERPVVVVPAASGGTGATEGGAAISAGGDGWGAEGLGGGGRGAAEGAAAAVAACQVPNVALSPASRLLKL